MCAGREVNAVVDGRKFSLAFRRTLSASTLDASVAPTDIRVIVDGLATVALPFGFDEVDFFTSTVSSGGLGGGKHNFHVENGRRQRGHHLIFTNSMQAS